MHTKKKHKYKPTFKTTEKGTLEIESFPCRISACEVKWMHNTLTRTKMHRVSTISFYTNAKR